MSVKWNEPKGKRLMEVCNHFLVSEDNKKVKCRICEAIMLSATSPSTLRYHLTHKQKWFWETSEVVFNHMLSVRRIQH